MTPQAQRIAIAELCGLKIIGPDHPRYSQYTLQYSSPGWRLASYPGLGFKGVGPSQVTSKEQCEQWIERDKDYRPGQTMEEAELIEHVPHYPSDLNAMAEAEKTLGPRDREVYASILSGDPTVPSPESYIGYIEFPAADVFEAFIHASAAQRAEAFLCTLGKWE